jgi:ribosome-binding protein aMBF1 (putative translation factor)
VAYHIRRKAMATNFKDYVAASRAAESPEDAAIRKVFAEDIRLGLEYRDARVNRGLTQRQLAALSGVPQADISRIERGGGNPTEATLQRLAAALERRLSLV